MSQVQLDSVDRHWRSRVRTVQAIDEMVAAIVQTLTESGQLDNTYIVFGTDNGYHLGEHRLMGSPGFDGWDVSNKGGKNTGFDEDIRVPLLICGPGITAGTRLAEVVGNIDLAPTFADIAGITPPTFVDGRSFLPLVHGKPVSWRTEIRLESAHGSIFKGLRTVSHLYLRNEGQGEELYDLRSDPHQLHNLARQEGHRPLLRSLRTQVAASDT